MVPACQPHRSVLPANAAQLPLSIATSPPLPQWQQGPHHKDAACGVDQLQETTVRRDSLPGGIAPNDGGSGPKIRSGLHQVATVLSWSLQQAALGTAPPAVCSAGAAGAAILLPRGTGSPNGDAIFRNVYSAALASLRVPAVWEAADTTRDGEPA